MKKSKRKVVALAVICQVLAFCFFSASVQAASDYEMKRSVHMPKSNVKTEDVITCDEQCLECEEICSHRDGLYCGHFDPTLPSPDGTPSSMRYIRTVNHYNYIELRYDIREYYQCVFCGYEEFYVHGYIYD